MEISSETTILGNSSETTISGICRVRRRFRNFNRTFNCTVPYSISGALWGPRVPIYGALWGPRVPGLMDPGPRDPGLRDPGLRDPGPRVPRLRDPGTQGGAHSRFPVPADNLLFYRKTGNFHRKNDRRKFPKFSHMKLPKKSD